MTPSLRIAVSCLAITLIAFVSRGDAQVAHGQFKFGSYGGGPFDVVNLGNLNANFKIPIVHKNGRGLPFVYDLIYNSATWYPATSGGTTSWTPVANWGWTSTWGGISGYLTYSSFTTYCYDGMGHQTGVTYTYSGWTYHDPWSGKAHGFSGQVVIYGGSCSGTNILSFTSTDSASGLTLTVNGTSGTITTPEGISIIPPNAIPTGPVSAPKTDYNGNQLTSTTGGVFTDTLGTTALTISGTNPVNFAYTASGGASKSYALNYGSYNVKTNFGCSGVSEYTASAVGLVSSIGLPDGSQYSFTYEPTPGFSGYYTGRLKKVTLPSGGSITYTYTGSNNGIICADGSPAGLSRAVSPGGTWTYARSGSAHSWTTTITDPTSGANQTVINFSKDNATGGLEFYETQRKVYQGSSSTGTLLLTTLNCYNSVFSTCSTAAVSSPISRKDAYVVLASKNSVVESLYDTYGRLTDTKEYDYGVALNAAPSSTYLVRETATSYASLGNILNRPSQITVKNQAGTVIAQTTYTYDEGTPTPTSGTPNHVSAGSSRGNATTISSLVSGTTSLTSHASYYDTGNINVATDVNGATTTYVYGSGSCGNSFATEVDLPLSLKRYVAWDTTCAGAVTVSSTDENNNITSYTYGDVNYWRPTAIAYPDGGSTSFTYNTSTSTPWSATQTQTRDTNSAHNVITATVYDGFGRPSSRELVSDPNGTSSIDTAYDAVGRVASVTNPHYSTSSPTDGTTSYSYDALSRATTITRPDGKIVQLNYTNAAGEQIDEGYNSAGTTHIKRISQSDGLGRVTSICEETSVTQQGSSNNIPASCGLDISGTGFLTTYGYDVLDNRTSVTQGGLNARTFAYDGLSRMTSQANPESGTTAYVYDTGTKGDLYTRTRPKPNQSNPSITITTTYGFDSLHRLTSTSYSDSSPGATFGYDEATPLGQSASNPKGLLTHATFNGTQTVLSYDTMGRIVDDWQCTPLNCGTSWFRMNYVYDYLGNATSHQNYKEAVTYTYNYDSAARLTLVQSNFVDTNHPGTLLTVNSGDYNALGEAKKETLGNGIVRTISYDNRGRITSVADGSMYSYAITYAPDSLVLTGNDSVNGNWTYAYDDFGRISTSSKSGQAFQYLYDRYGNRWKQNVTTGSGPNPSYTFDANNHIGTGVTYDAAGNITNDGFHSYTYDDEGRLVAVDTTAATYLYDASGHRVRETVAGISTELVYDLSAKAETWGNSAGWSRGQIFSGGRDIGTYNNSTTYFNHSDWTRTLRALSSVAGVSIETCTSLAFGDAQSCTGTDRSALHFTDQEYDATSNLSHFWFRKYSSTQGRWTTPDPAGAMVAAAASPQSWNLYTYTLNNPVNYVDPTGLFCQWDDGTTDDEESDGGASPQQCYDQGGNWVDSTVITVDGGGNQGVETVTMENGWQIFPTVVPANESRQTFSQCMAANSSTFSLAGLAQGAVNAALGTSFDFQDTWWAQLIGGNAISGTLFGSPGDAAMSAGVSTPGLVDEAMGTVTTFGRHSERTTIMAMNIAGKGGLPQALSSSTRGLKSVLGAADDVFSLGMGLTTRLEVDAALAAAEAAYCAYKTR